MIRSKWRHKCRKEISSRFINMTWQEKEEKHKSLILQHTHQINGSLSHVRDKVSLHCPYKYPTNVLLNEVCKNTVSESQDRLEKVKKDRSTCGAVKM